MYVAMYVGYCKLSTYCMARKFGGQIYFTKFGKKKFYEWRDQAEG